MPPAPMRPRIRYSPNTLIFCATGGDFTAAAADDEPAAAGEAIFSTFSTPSNKFCADTIAACFCRSAVS